MLRNTRSLPWSAAVLSLAGLLFCLWVFITGGQALCLTDGCTLFQDFSLAGISLWQAGAFLFSCLLMLALFRLSMPAFLLSGAALCADTALLGIMLFTAPCINCLIVGAIIALSFLAFRLHALHEKTPRSVLACLWAFLLMLNLGSVLHDSADPWSPWQKQLGQSSVHVYFSPSCRACQTLLSHADSLKSAEWFPVPEDSRDIWVIADMINRVQEGTSLAEAAEAARASIPEGELFQNDMSFRIGLLNPQMLLLQFRLWKNHAHVLAAGSNRLPFVEYKGLPSFLAQNAPPAPQSILQDPVRGESALPELDVAGFCSDDKEKPCEEIPSSQGQTLIDISGMIQKED